MVLIVWVVKSVQIRGRKALRAWWRKALFSGLAAISESGSGCVEHHEALGSAASINVGKRHLCKRQTLASGNPASAVSKKQLHQTSASEKCWEPDA